MNMLTATSDQKGSESHSHGHWSNIKYQVGLGEIIMKICFLKPSCQDALPHSRLALGKRHALASGKELTAHGHRRLEQSQAAEGFRRRTGIIGSWKEIATENQQLLKGRQC